MKLTVLIAEDERLAREELVYMLSKEPDLELLEPACSGKEAMEAVLARRPDAVFLDVEMPEMTGLQAARALMEAGNPPLFVFTTAYDHYAVDAFGVEAVDYLLKPYDEERLRQALRRLRERKQKGMLEQPAGGGEGGASLAEAGHAAVPAAEAGSKLAAAAAAFPAAGADVRHGGTGPASGPAGAVTGQAGAGNAAGTPSAATSLPLPVSAGPASARRIRLLIEDGGKMVVLDGRSLLFAVKEEKLTRIRMADGNEYTARQTLQELEERLGAGYFRPHRSYLVNLDYIREIQPWFNGAYNAVLKHAEEIRIPVSRSAAKEMLRLLEEGG
ncbi:LytR/AlgR family response regulator transcription factor [Paenibacillus sp. D51F]